MEAKREQTQVSIIHRETVKPSSPTTPQFFKLSFMDQVTPPIHSPFLLIYENNSDQDDEATHCQADKRAKLSQHLRKSLSEILARYYLFAGRITDDLSVINCNDEGVPYLEARANFSVSSLLQHPRNDELNSFMPTNPGNDLSLVLLVQVTFFSCGGVAIGMLFSHKIADSASIVTFAKAWASASLGHPDEVVPDFTTAGSLFPPMSPFPIKLPPASNQQQQNLEAYATRRFVFDASKVAALRDRATGRGQRRPTRVEAVSALLWKCTVAAAAASSSRSGATKKPSILMWPVNLRNKVVPPLLGSAIGNIFLTMKVQSDERAKALWDWVNQLRTGMKEFREKYVEKLHGAGSVPVILNLFNRYLEDGITLGGSVNYYTHNSCCGMSVYEIDFGWGKPTWMRLNDVSSNPNVTVLSDRSDGQGIEAWVNLMKEDMALLERDPELLEFATINPSPLQQARNKVYHPSALAKLISSTY